MLNSPWHWDDLQLFLAVARGGGLSPAAAETGRSPATLGRRMQALEAALGKTLFVRHGRGYDLTEAGQALRDDLAEVEARLVRLGPQSRDDALPRIRIAAGSWTTLALVEAIDRLRGARPDVTLGFLAQERLTDLPRREAEIGFRNRRPTDANLAGRALRPVDFAIYARPGAPGDWIAVTADTPSARWVAARVSRPVCEVSAPRNALDLLEAGIGQAVLPTFIGDTRPRLERRGPPIAELRHDAWLVVHQDDRHMSHVRRVIDRAVAVLSA